MRPTLTAKNRERAIARSLAAAEKREKEAPRRVYLLRGATTGMVKIGHSIDPAARIAGFQCGSGERLEIAVTFAGDQRLEQWLHRRFAQDRSHGEWFYPSLAIVQFIEAAKHPGFQMAAQRRWDREIDGEAKHSRAWAKLLAEEGAELERQKAERRRLKPAPPPEPEKPRIGPRPPRLVLA